MTGTSTSATARPPIARHAAGHGGHPGTGPRVPPDGQRPGRGDQPAWSSPAAAGTAGPPRPARLLPPSALGGRPRRRDPAGRVGVGRPDGGGLRGVAMAQGGGGSAPMSTATRCGRHGHRSICTTTGTRSSTSGRRRPTRPGRQRPPGPPPRLAAGTPGGRAGRAGSLPAARGGPGRRGGSAPARPGPGPADQRRRRSLHPAGPRAAAASGRLCPSSFTAPRPPCGRRATRWTGCCCHPLQPRPPPGPGRRRPGRWAT